MVKTSYTHSMMWQLENLETRKLLSASVGIESLVQTDPAALVSPMVKTPNIVSTWTGTDRTTHPRSRQLENITFYMISQSRRGVLAGEMGVPGPSGPEQLPFTGTISGDSVKISGNSNGIVFAVTGTISADGKTFSGTWSNSIPKSGTFSVSRP